MNNLKNNVIRADTVGGEASKKGIFDYHTIKTIEPIPNRIVLIDHTNFENIHGWGRRNAWRSILSKI